MTAILGIGGKLMREPHKIISTTALIDNYRYLQQLCSGSQVLAVVKCDAYGHGLLSVARQLAAANVDGFAVASVQEGVTLRKAGIENKTLVLQGAHRAEDFAIAAAQRLSLVVHSNEQLLHLEANSNLHPLDLWIKFDTGMNRLGFSPESADQIIARIMRLPGLTAPPVLMSHFCCLDPMDKTTSNQQWDVFHSICAQYDLPASMANSSACLQMPQTHLQWTRAGIALYGITPAAEHQAPIKPVMRLFAPLIAIKHCRAGDGIGYGHRYICPQDMAVGIVAIGYGDGYPRHAPDGTPVWLQGQREQLLGRVSMDMLAISVNPETAAVGDLVELWGTHIAVDEVAALCNTISYELLTSVSGVREV